MSIRAVIVIAVLLLSSSGSSYTSHPIASTHRNKIYTRLINHNEVYQVHFPVYGNNMKEIIENLSKVGPIDLEGARRWADVKWYIHWSWPITSTNKPLFRETKVRSSIKVNLPELILQNQTDPVLSKWSNFDHSLRKHELQHVLHALLGRHLVSTAIKIRVERTKNLTAKQANRSGHRILKRIRKIDKRYDALTDHGRSDNSLRVSIADFGEPYHQV